ncbi:DUF4864 domain-containing protein [uncultured Roseovarius sp.]|uniref:DUF4864 domain-containing protein n=1 Tax=uncultured Roseovarius sp. TaxID=293344 RepID=UPI00260A1DF0|nr:DUF4864 domain-containing protein [uncultured Roseovarius sp.]
MRYLILSFAVVLGLVGPLHANDGARAVISAQIEAFLAEDVDRAYNYASPFIQDKFGSPERFGDMVREGYPMVWQPSDVVFLEAEEIGGSLWQSVSIRDVSGKGWIVDYEMIESEGGWLINGVRVRRAPESLA